MSDGNPIDRVPPEPAVVEVPLGSAHRERVERAANAAHMLCEVLWEALHEQLGARSDWGAVSNVGSAPTQRAGELAERLADVAATIALLASGDGHAIGTPTPNMAHTARSAAPAEPTSADAPSTAVLIDEREEHAPTPDQGPAPAAAPPLRPQTNPPPQSWHASPSEHARASHTPPRNEMLEEYGREGPAAWIDLIGRALEQFERDRLPFAVLLIELLDVKSLRLGGRAGELPRLTRQIENALAQALEAIGGRPATSLTSERPDRYWLLVQETDRLAAQALAERLVRTFVPVRAAAGTADPAEQYFAALSAQRSPLRARQNGPPLQLAVGTAACPENGREAAALVAHAEVELSAARAAGQLIVSVAEPV
jgi:GGDEF domain-containing protein